MAALITDGLAFVFPMSRYEFSDVVLVNLARLHVAVKPAVDSLEGNAKFLGELGLAQLVFEAVGVELVNQVLRHGELRYNDI